MRNKYLKIIQMFSYRKIYQLAKTDSTNKYMAALIKKNKQPNGSVVHAAEQFEGKGQGSNKWESEAGKNLTFSMLYYPENLIATKQFYISKTIALTCCAFIEETLNHNFPVTIKWPNDIYIGNMKVGGVLIENNIRFNTIQSSIIGVGLNINQKKFPNHLPNAISLYQLLLHESEIPELLDKLLQKTNVFFNILHNGQYYEIDKLYLNKLFRFGEIKKYKDKKGVFTGKVVDVEESGALVIETTNNEVRKYYFKEVEYIL